MKQKINELLEELGRRYSTLDNSNQKINGYALITNMPKKNSILIVGFNWGEAENSSYAEQGEIEECGSFYKLDIGSFKRIEEYCREAGLCLKDASMTNYCFFRSKIEQDISQSEINLCEDLFFRLLDVVSPSKILCFSVRLRDYLMGGKVDGFEIVGNELIPSSNGRTYKAVSGRFKGVDIYFLPHPNARIKKEIRAEWWGLVLKNNSRFYEDKLAHKNG